MPDQSNPFVREGLVRRTAPFVAALIAGFVMVPLLAEGDHELRDFTTAIVLTALMALLVVLLPWRRLPAWLQMVPPLLYMVVVAELYTQGGGPSSGFGSMVLLPILWLALYSSQAQMVASIVGCAVVVLGPLLTIGGSPNPDPEYRRGILILIVGTVIGFTVQRLVGRVSERASRESERAANLEESTHQFDRAFETAPIGMAITTVAGRFMRVNPTLCSMLGRVREDLVGRKIEEIAHPDDRVVDRDAIPKLLSGEVSTYQAEKRYLHIDGQVVWVILSLTLVRDSDGNPRHLFAQMQDVTAPRLAEERLREAEERYRTMVEQLPLVTYIDALDDISSAIYMSPQVEPLLGYSVQEWLDDTELFAELLHPDDRERVLAEVVRCNKSGAPFVEEYRLTARDGRTVWIRDEAHHLQASDGTLKQMQGLMIDITERKLAETRLRLQHSVASAIAASDSLRDAAPAVLRSICEAMEWDVGTLWQVDYRADELRCVDLWQADGVELGEFERATREWTFKPGEGLAGRVWSEAAPHWTPDFASEPEFPRASLFAQTGLRAAAAFPVSASGREVGVIEFLSRKVSEPEAEVMLLMAAIGTQLGQFIERMQAEERLREAEERYRQLVERLPAISYIASFGESGKWLFVSPQIETTLGFTPAEWTTDSSSWYRQIHPDDRERVMEAEREVRKSDEPFSTEYRILARDGTVHWVRDEGIVIRDGDRPGYMSGMMTDVTEQKLTEQALRESEKRFRTLGTHAPVGIFETNASGICTFVNERWCELSGRTPEQIAGREWMQVIHPDDRERVEAEWREAALQGWDYEGEFRFVTPDGHVRVVDASAVPLRDDPGAAASYLGTVVDVTERRRVEHYQSIQHAVSMAMADSTGCDDAIKRMIAALGESMGWELGVFWGSELQEGTTAPFGRPVPLLRCVKAWHAGEVPGVDFVELCDEMTFSSPLGMLGRVWEGGHSEWSEDLGDARSKRAQLARQLGMTGSVCLAVYGDAQLLGVLEFFGRKVEDPGEPLLDIHAGIGRQIGEYIERKRAEGEAERAKNEFFALVSHELRTPLTSIIGYLELVHEEKSMSAEERRHFLDIVHRNADRLLRLVGDLLLVAQVQVGKFALRPGVVDLRAIAEHAIETARPIAEGRTIELGLNADPVPVFQGDRDRIAQLFDNLISNALKFTDPGQRVTVSVSTTGGRAVVEVNNSGAVIPEKERARLFDRFYRASEATSRVVTGVGLGLAIVKAIVEAHQGTIVVESTEVSGTTFRASLPLNEPREADLAADEMRAA